MRSLDNLIVAGVLIRIGQELGTDGPLARAVVDLISILMSMVTR
jgi:hypothetical protein